MNPITETKKNNGTVVKKTNTSINVHNDDDDDDDTDSK